MATIEEIRKRLISQQIRNPHPDVYTPPPPKLLRTKFVTIEGEDLICPRCECNNLHQVGVTAYWRKEDADQVFECTSNLSNEGHAGITDGTNNPSSRRQGIAIVFECEQCTGLKPLELTISQHKGSTLMEWR